jgi:type I restriction enzyme, S subunit
MSSDPTNQLPPGWVEATLGEIAELGAGGPAPQEEEHFSRDGQPFVRVQDLGRLGSRVWIAETVDRVNQNGIHASRLRLLPAGSVLFTKSGMSTLLNQRAILASEAYVVSHIGYATPEPGILSQWLYWALKRIDLGALAHATTLPSLKLSKVQEVKILVAPTGEQRRIVAEIDKQFTRLEAGVAALQRAQANLKRYRAAVLKAAVEGRLVPTEAELARAESRSYEPADQLLQRILAERRARWEANQLAKFRASGKEPKDDKWRPKYKEATGPDLANLPSLPEGWAWARAEQLCGFITKGTTPVASKLFAGSGEVPYIKVYNLTHRGTLDFHTNLTFVGSLTHSGELARSRVLPGDVLMNIVGPPLGKVSIVPDFYPEWNVNQAIAIFRPMPSYNTRLLSFCLLSEAILAWAVSRGKATAGQFNLTLEVCRDLPLPVPPLVEQSRIVAEVERRLSVIDELEMQVEANLNRAERLRQAILRRAFEGKLVPQDPDDEPASVLLDHIRAEREARKQATSGTKKGRQAKPARAVAAAEG